MSVLRTALIVHVVTLGWLLINGTAHTAQVLWKARAGTLNHGPEGLQALLAVGAGLFVAGAAYTYSVGGMMRSGPVALGPAFAAAGVLAVVIAGIARHYGFAFLTGTIVLFLLHLGCISVAALKLRAGA